jgi:hypothetical protein
MNQRPLRPNHLFMKFVTKLLLFKSYVCYATTLFLLELSGKGSKGIAHSGDLLYKSYDL